MPNDVKRELHSRIMAIAAVHEHLHREENFDGLDLGGYLRGISEAVNASYGDAVRLEFEFDGVEVGPDTATTLGLIVNELITNTNKYAFADRRPGRFGARLTKGEGRAELSIYNDGIPFNAGARADGIGIRLIRSLAGSLDPHYTLDGANGLDFRISFDAMA